MHRFCVCCSAPCASNILTLTLSKRGSSHLLFITPQRSLLWPSHLTNPAVVQSPNHVQIFAAQWTAAYQASQSFTISQSLVKLMSIAIQPSHLLLPSSPFPSIFPSIKVFSNKLAILTRWPTYWSFSFSISPSKEYSGLTSFTIDWFDLLAVRGTLKNILQHHSFKASIIQPALWSSSHIHTWPLERQQPWLYRPLSTKWCLCFLMHCLGLS